METAEKTAPDYYGIRGLYYITHIDNIPSILRKGIFSHQRIKDEDLKHVPIYNEQIISKRQNIKAPNGRSLWDFANLYFNARNPMLYKVRCDKPIEDIAVLEVSPGIITRDDICVTTGNAAHRETDILPISVGRKFLRQIAKETDREYWGEADGSKRKIMAECLVPDIVPPEYINSIFVAGHSARNRVQRSLVAPYALSVINHPKMFFRPSMHKLLASTKISLFEGDMFFSRMQTLTVSVNVVGVMGKGVASRAKYQFPDVYVRYQDACRRKQLKMGTPYLYKRESSADIELADEPSTLRKANAATWFLLFPTKRHWRDQADIDSIEKGLQWICENYRKDRIKGLALPALGCGLGRLEWKDVGSLLCRYLSTLDIPVSLYLPTERGIPQEQLSEDFLLPKGARYQSSLARATN